MNLRRGVLSLGRLTLDSQHSVPEVNSKATVFAGTLQTDPDSIVDADPLRTVRAAVKTILQTERLQRYNYDTFGK